MKVVPGNQTLILANERPNLSGSPGKRLGQALTDAANGSALKRVTIVAAQPESMIYLQADYQPASSLPYSPQSAMSARLANADDADADSSPVARALVPSNGSLTSRQAPVASGTRDAFGNQPSTNRYVGLYARTQTLITDVPAYPHIDVLA